MGPTALERDAKVCQWHQRTLEWVPLDFEGDPTRTYKAIHKPWDVQLGCPTLINQHFILILIFVIVVTKYKKCTFLLIIVVAIWIDNEFPSFCDMVFKLP